MKKNDRVFVKKMKKNENFGKKMTKLVEAERSEEPSEARLRQLGGLGAL